MIDVKKLYAEADEFHNTENGLSHAAVYFAIHGEGGKGEEGLYRDIRTKLQSKISKGKLTSEERIALISQSPSMYDRLKPLTPLETIGVMMPIPFTHLNGNYGHNREFDVAKRLKNGKVVLSAFGKKLDLSNPMILTHAFLSNPKVDDVRQKAIGNLPVSLFALGLAMRNVQHNIDDCVLRNYPELIDLHTAYNVYSSNELDDAGKIIYANEYVANNLKRTVFGPSFPPMTSSDPKIIRGATIAMRRAYNEQLVRMLTQSGEERSTGRFDHLLETSQITSTGYWRNSGDSKMDIPDDMQVQVVSSGVDPACFKSPTPAAIDMWKIVKLGNDLRLPSDFPSLESYIKWYSSNDDADLIKALAPWCAAKYACSMFRADLTRQSKRSGRGDHTFWGTSGVSSGDSGVGDTHIAMKNRVKKTIKEMKVLGVTNDKDVLRFYLNYMILMSRPTSLSNGALGIAETVYDAFKLDHKINPDIDQGYVEYANKFLRMRDLPEEFDMAYIALKKDGNMAEPVLRCNYPMHFRNVERSKKFQSTLRARNLARALMVLDSPFEDLIIVGGRVQRLWLDSKRSDRIVSRINYSRRYDSGGTTQMVAHLLNIENKLNTDGGVATEFIIHGSATGSKDFETKLNFVMAHPRSRDFGTVFASSCSKPALATLRNRCGGDPREFNRYGANKSLHAELWYLL